MSGKASLVLLTRNRRSELQTALAQTERAMREGYIDEVVVVDNASIDDTSAMIEREYPAVRLVKLTTNSGVAEGRNVGARYAQNELLLYLDEDGTFDFAAIPEMVECFTKCEKAAAVAAVVSECRGRPMCLPAGAHTGAPLQTYTYFGGAVMLRKSVFERLGGYCSYFFYSGEEDDFCWRLLEAGYVILRYDGAVLHHRKSGQQRPLLRKVFYYYRNKLFEIWRNVPLRQAFTESMFVIAGGVVRTAFSWQLPALVGAVLATLWRLPRVCTLERTPVSRSTYAKYCQLKYQNQSWLDRVKRLLSDVKQGKRLGWV